MAAPRKRRSSKVTKSKLPLTDLPVRDVSGDEVVGGSMTMIAGTEFETEALQTENSNYTTISNIMKTKHDAAQNAINNVR